MLGIAQVELGKFSEGKKTLKKAQAFDNVKSQARAWINFAEQKRSHQQWKVRAAKVAS